MKGNRRFPGGAGETGRGSNPADGGRLAGELDPRLADVWLEVFQTGIGFSGLEEEQLACLLRMAYLRGYSDGLWEPERGLLFRRLGIEVPPRRRPASRSRTRNWMT